MLWIAHFRSQVSFCRLIRKLLPTTLTLEIAIAPAATIGLSSPRAATTLINQVVRPRSYLSPR